ncbi:unnamed protein product [Pleuronectes platessa]|uniref:Uncharacterized protein n=1 Tax=Pleuronectes platessa TaxID=8262 RepID=A0A9N7VE49_PLEPL|nr:unnamed protein product [Pleuronectes platessa]
MTPEKDPQEKSFFKNQQQNDRPEVGSHQIPMQRVQPEQQSKSQTEPVPLGVGFIGSQTGVRVPPGVRKVVQGVLGAIDVPDEVKLVSSEKLTKLIAKEIAECVNSVLSMSVDSVKETIPRITPPERLQCMIQQAGQMIKGLMTNLKNQQLVNKEDSQSSSSSRKTISEDRESLLSATSKTVQEIIKDEVSQFTESSSDGISLIPTDYEQLESGSTLEIKNVADDVAEVIVDEIMSQNPVDLETAQSTPSLKKMCGRIKTCAAEQFAQASICHIVERLDNKYFHSPDNPAFDKVLDSQGSGSESEVTTSEFKEEYSEEQEDERKSLIRIIVMKLVSRIFDKAKVLVELRSPNTIIERLIEKIWIEIEDDDFEITPNMMKRLDKSVCCVKGDGLLSNFLPKAVVPP